MSYFKNMYKKYTILNFQEVILSSFNVLSVSVLDFLISFFFKLVNRKTAKVLAFVNVVFNICVGLEK